MIIDDLAHEAEVEAEVLRAVSSLGAEKAERLLIALAFKIKQATPEAKPVVLGDAFEQATPRSERAFQLAVDWSMPIEVPTRAPAGTLGELSQRIVDFLDEIGGSTMSDIKDRCSNSKWSRNRVGTEVFNLVQRGTLEPLDVPLGNDGKKYAWYRVTKPVVVEAPVT